MEKKWVRQMQRRKSIGIREKWEESQISHSCLTGSQLAPQKKKQKRNPNPGVNASGGGCERPGAGRGEGRPGRFTIVSGSRCGSPGGGRRREEAAARASAPFAPPDLGRCALSQAREQQQ